MEEEEEEDERGMLIVVGDSAQRLRGASRNACVLWTVSVRVHRLHLEVYLLHLAAVSHGCELDDRVEVALEVGELFVGLVKEVGE